MCKPSRVLPWILLACLLGSSPILFAQDKFSEGLELDREDGYLPLPTGFGTVLYPPSYLDRASRVMDRLALTGLDLYVWSKNAVKVDLLILDLEGWQKRFPDRLYGLPTRTSPTSIATAAQGTPGTVRVWSMLLGHPVPPAPGEPVRGTPEQAMTLVLSDFLLQLEMGKIFAEQAGYAQGEARWPVDVLAHITAISFIDRHDAGQLTIYDDLFESLGKEKGPHPLEDLDRDLPLAKQLWYQARFREAATLILREDAAHAISRIQRKMRKRKQLEPSQVLLELYPELDVWLRSSFGDAPIN